MGYLTGFIEDDTERSILLPLAAVAAGAAGAVVLFAGEGMLLGDPRVTLHAVGRSLASSVPYAVVLTPFVVPVLSALARRIESDPIRR
jgi:hypothetical protein